jgi:hypothetical protein
MKFMTNNLLTADHAGVGELFGELDAALGAGIKTRAFALLDLAWARLAVHIRAEHLCLFPAIREALADANQAQAEAVLTSDEAQALIAQLREDHNFFMTELSSAITSMRELQLAPDAKSEREVLRHVREKVASVASRLDIHNRLEEERLYSLPANLLPAGEEARLMARVRHELENMPPRFSDPERPENMCGGPG